MPSLVTVASPSSPAHEGSETGVAVAEISGGALGVKSAVAVQSLASVMVTVYVVPALNPVACAVLSLLDQA